MLHAKTAVADGRWARVGSTNLNLTSWLGNWELDVAVEDEAFAGKMEAMYEDDLKHATEVVLSPRRRVQAASPKAGRARPARQGSTAVGCRRRVWRRQHDRRGDYESPPSWACRGAPAGSGRRRC